MKNKKDYISNEEHIEFFEKLADQHGLIKQEDNKWKFKWDSYDDIYGDPLYYKLTPLGFTLENPMGYTKNSKIDNSLKMYQFAFALIIGFLSGILINMI